MYDVHIFTVVRVKLSGVDAPTPTDAIAWVKEQLDFYNLFSDEHLPPTVDHEWAEEHSHYMVDVVGDAEFEQTESFLDADHVVCQNKMLDDGIHQV